MRHSFTCLDDDDVKRLSATEVNNFYCDRLWRGEYVEIKRAYIVEGLSFFAMEPCIDCCSNCGRSYITRDMEHCPTCCAKIVDAPKSVQPFVLKYGGPSLEIKIKA